DFLRLGGFAKPLFIGHPACLPIVRADLSGIVGEGARLVATRRDYLEIIPAGATKGTALRVLAEHLGIPLEETIAVGDQENDLEMIEAAGLGIAMPQAPEGVRKAARQVAPSDTEGGLLALFREILPQHFACPAPSIPAAPPIAKANPRATSAPSRRAAAPPPRRVSDGASSASPESAAASACWRSARAPASSLEMPPAWWDRGDR